MILTGSERLAWLRLARTHNIGPVAFANLIARFGSASTALKEVPRMAQRGGAGNFVLPPEGEAELAQNKETLDHINAHMNGVRERSMGGQAPQIVRAIQNFRMALHLRMERGQISDEQANAIAAAIDAAAQTIERS